MRQSKSNKGFTLIELLIVIAIIGILAAVLIPNLLQARKRANDTAAQAYLREMMQQQEIYYLDEDSYAADASTLEGEYLKNSPAGIEVAISASSTVDDQGYFMCSKHKNGSGTFVSAEDGQVMSEEDYEDAGGTESCGSFAKVGS